MRRLILSVWYNMALDSRYPLNRTSQREIISMLTFSHREMREYVMFDAHTPPFCCTFSARGISADSIAECSFLFYRVVEL